MSEAADREVIGPASSFTVAGPRNWWRSVIEVVPHGRVLPAEDWDRRHRVIVIILWLYAAGLVGFGWFQGYSPTHLAVDGGAVAVFAAWATQPLGGRKLRACLASLGLLVAAALGVHLSGGKIEAHFAYFVVIALLMVYQDWLPFLVAIAFVVLEHGTIGILLPAAVYDHAAAQSNPWAWAGIHGAFVLAASTANLAYWRFSEIDHERAMAAQHKAARVDGLTGATNRRGWEEELPRTLALAGRNALPLSLAILDFDNFKDYNDSWGHQKGDLLLQRAVDSWKMSLREEDVLARYGGDEFGLIMPGCNLASAVSVLDRLYALAPEGQTCSVGVGLWNGEESASELIARVDSALYERKKRKALDSNHIIVARDDSTRPGTMAWTDRIPRLLAGRNIDAAFQPIFELGERRVAAYEALARPADDPKCESVEGLFDAAKRLGYLRDLDWLCRRAALEQGDAAVRRWPLFINVSLASFLDPIHSVDQMVLLCQWAGRSPHQVVLEITEQAEARDLRLLQSVIHAYRDEGFRFAVDDVGEGHSTLELLIAADPEFIKIARSLVANLSAQSARSAVEAIIAFAGSQGSRVIAEGIETDEELQAVRDLGVTMGQGYLLGRPQRQRREDPVAVPRNTAEAARLSPLAGSI